MPFGAPSTPSFQGDVASARKSVVFGRFRESNSPRAVYAMIRAAKFIWINHKDAEGREASWPGL